MQSGSIVKDQISVHMTLHWYRPLFPALDQPLARDLLDYQTVHDDAARRVDEEPLGPWAVTEHQVGGVEDVYKRQGTGSRPGRAPRCR